VSELDGLVAIVTGGAQGIGREITAALLSAGAKVAILDADDQAALRAVQELGGSEAGLLATKADVSASDEVEAAVATAVGRFGRLDLLINNAGIRHIESFLEYPLEGWRRTLDVNLTGAFVCARAVIPHMRKSGRGKIVNLSSIAGALALSGSVAYNVSKAGIIMLTKTIAYELGPEGIYCNAVAPGVIETPLTRAYFEDEDFSRMIVENTPLRRWAQPSEIAQPVVFLCSGASDFINGETLFVDGGWVIGKGY
jgi:NAD(P)-dependent dehydrogenase (short-subunit alcohol dehydrogenase family)